MDVRASIGTLGGEVAGVAGLVTHLCIPVPLHKGLSDVRGCSLKHFSATAATFVHAFMSINSPDSSLCIALLAKQQITCILGNLSETSHCFSAGTSAASLRGAFFDSFASYAVATDRLSLELSAQAPSGDEAPDEDLINTDRKLLVLLSNCAFVRGSIMPSLIDRYALLEICMMASCRALLLVHTCVSKRRSQPKCVSPAFVPCNRHFTHTCHHPPRLPMLSMLLRASCNG